MTDPKVDDAYKIIATQLRGFTPSVELDEHIVAGSLRVRRTTLDGIRFDVRDSHKLKAAVRGACDATGQPAFAEARERISGTHWAVAASFKETPGTGFREIWRPRLTRRGLSLADAQPNRLPPLESRMRARLGGQIASPGLAPMQWDMRDAARFGDAQGLPDLSSLHWGISWLWATVHIDEMGFVMAGPGGEIVVNPDFLRQIVVE